MDLRLIIGRLFLVIGALLIMAAYLAPSSIRSELFGTNVNLAWGIVLLLCGGVFSFSARKSS
jgi:hypothetical protein